MSLSSSLKTSRGKRTTCPTPGSGRAPSFRAFLHTAPEPKLLTIKSESNLPSVLSLKRTIVLPSAFARSSAALWFYCRSLPAGANAVLSGRTSQSACATRTSWSRSCCDGREAYKNVPFDGSCRVVLGIPKSFIPLNWFFKLDRRVLGSTSTDCRRISCRVELVRFGRGGNGGLCPASVLPVSICRPSCLPGVL